MTKIKFNSEQMEAIDHHKGSCGVIAAAGSGKSTILVERINQLVNTHSVQQHDILAITFTKATSVDLTSKLKKLGLDFVNVGTFHAICGRILHQEGIYIDGRNLIKEWQIDNCFRAIDQEADTKEIMSFISYQKNYMKDYNDEFIPKESNYDEDRLREFFKAYETMKKREHLYDFDDYLLLCLDVLRKNKGKYTFDYILVDEHQDSNLVQNELLKEWCESGNIFVVGDYRQCLIPETPIKTPEGYKYIKDIKKDDIVTVASGRGDSYNTEVNDVISKNYKGKLIELTTKSGKVIKGTPEHTIFLNTLIPEMKHFVYLMYKIGYGFRMGITSQHSVLKDGKKMTRNGYDNRIRYEGADKLWVIKTLDNKQDALYYENEISYKYGIPQYVFKSRSRKNGSLTSDNVKKLYKNLPTYERGQQLLKDYGLFFDSPHVEVTGFLMKDIDDEDNTRVKRRIGFTLFGSSRKSKSKETNYKGNFHEMGVSSIDENFVKTVAKSWNKNYQTKFNGSKTSEYSVSRWIGIEHDKMFELSDLACEEYKENYGGEAAILRRAVLTENPRIKFHFMPLINAIEGMSVPILKNGKIVEDTITSVKQLDYEGLVYDLNIDNYRNYIANDIVVHNCIYGFRGSDTKYFMNFDQHWNNPSIINVSTNYRSPKNIVNNANNFIKKYYGQYKHYKDAIAHIQEDGLIEINTYQNEIEEGSKVVDKIEELINNGTELNDIAVLYRVNKQSHYVENELKLRKIDYEIENNSSFFKRREIAAILSYLRLAQDLKDDNAFEQVFKSRHYPLKYFSGAIYKDIQAYAKDNGLSLYESINKINYPKVWHDKNVDIFMNNMRRLTVMANNNSSVVSMIDTIVDMFQMKHGIQERYSNLEEMKERMDSLEVLKSFVQNNNLDQFITYVYSSSDKKKKKDQAVKLMSVHRSKGLEFDNVFLIGLEDETFPHANADLNEEARLFYVATTRSKKNMWISETGIGSLFVRQYKD